MSDKPLKLVILISGNGSNLQAIIDTLNSEQINAEITAVISNKEGAYGLERAKQNNITTQVLDHKQYPNRAAYDLELQKCIDNFNPDLVILAGFMRILTDDFVLHYAGKIINIHPSLLPKYPGLHTHKQAIENSDLEHGSTVHFVIPELDAGPTIAQSSLEIQASDDATSLAARVQNLEHKLYPLVVRWFAEGKIELRDGTVYYSGKKLATNGIQIVADQVLLPN